MVSSIPVRALISAVIFLRRASVSNSDLSDKRSFALGVEFAGDAEDRAVFSLFIPSNAARSRFVLPITPSDDTFIEGIERIATPGKHERGRGHHHSGPPIKST